MKKLMPLLIAFIRLAACQPVPAGASPAAPAPTHTHTAPSTPTLILAPTLTFHYSTDVAPGVTYSPPSLSESVYLEGAGGSGQAGEGGDVYAAGAMRSYFPAGASPRVLLRDNASNFPGVVTYGTFYDFDPALSGNGAGYISSRGWNTNVIYPATDFYQVFYHRFGSPTPMASGDTTLSTQLAGSTDPYYSVGGRQWFSHQ